MVFFDGAPRQFGGSGGGFDEYRQQGGLGDSGHNALDALGGGREGGGGGGGLRYAEESEEGDGGGGGFLVHEGGGGEGSAGFGGGVTGPMFGTGNSLRAFARRGQTERFFLMTPPLSSLSLSLDIQMSAGALLLRWSSYVD